MSVITKIRRSNVLKFVVLLLIVVDILVFSQWRGSLPWWNRWRNNLPESIPQRWANTTEIPPYSVHNSTTAIIHRTPMINVSENVTTVATKLPLMIPPPTMLAPRLPKQFNPLSQADIESVQRFVFFIGYSRSGHSIVGSMMDAHPDMIIAHEYALFNQWKAKPNKHKDRRYLYNQLYQNSYNNAVYGWRSGKKDKKGYTLQFEHTWQGEFRQLKVIGDKAAGKLGNLYNSSQSHFLQIYEQLLQTVQVPVAALHVVRNPYDMIATRLLYTNTNRNGAKLTTVTEEHKYNNTAQLAGHSKRLFSLARTVQNITKDCNLKVLEIHLSELIQNFKSTAIIICNFVNVQCSEDFLLASQNKIRKTLSKTRLLVEWTPDLIEDIAKQMEQYPFFQRYSFHTDY